MNPEISIHTYKPGDPSMVCYFQYKLYEKQYNFNGFYEKEMLEGMAELYNDLEGSQMWVAELNGNIVGDIAIIFCRQYSTGHSHRKSMLFRSGLAGRLSGRDLYSHSGPLSLRLPQQRY